MGIENHNPTFSGVMIPEDFLKWKADDQWVFVCEKFNVSNKMNIIQILKTTPMPKSSLEQIFYMAARKNIFNDITKITMSLGQLMGLEESLRCSKKEINLKRNKQQLLENKELFETPVNYKQSVDDIRKNIHERLLHNFPLMDPGQMFQMMTDMKLTAIPTEQYGMNHIAGAGCVTTRGIFDAHDPSATGITLKDFVKKNAIKVNSGARKFVGGLEEGSPFIESEVQLEEITEIGECMEALFMLDAYKRRACMVDCSLEPLRRFLARRAWFIWDKEFRPTDVSPAKFCAGFIDYVTQQNAARFQAKLPFLVYTDMADTVKDFRMNIRGIDNTKTGANNQNGNQRFKQHNKNFPKQKHDKICGYFNRTPGCNIKGKECSTKKGGTYLHVCNFETASGVMCRGDHPAFNHKAKQDK